MWAHSNSPAVRSIYLLIIIIHDEAVHLVAEILDSENVGHAKTAGADEVIETRRVEIAAALGRTAHEVVLTSGGSEADNLAVLGVHDRRGGTVVCGATEHHAVLDPVEARGGRVAASGANPALAAGARARRPG